MEKLSAKSFLSFPLILFVLFSGLSELDAQWMGQTSGTTDDLNSVRFVDSLTGYAAGDNGTLLRTTNAGQDWVSQASGTTSRFFSNYFVNDSTGWAVGDGGMIRHTSDSGVTWSAQASTTTERLRDVFFIDATTGWAVGNNGTIIKTTNGGTTWSSQPSGTSDHLVGVRFVDASTGWVVGASGTIIHTSDGGSSWNAQTSGTTEHLGEVRFLGPDTGWVAGYSGTILHTTDGGTNWNSQSSGSTQTLESLHFINSSEGWAVGASGTILHTTDGGTNWSTQSSGVSSHLESIYFPSPHVGWTVGGGGTILRTSCSSSSDTLFVDACGSYTVPSGDETYTTSGVYQDTIYNVQACDSLLTVDLSIFDPVDTSVTELNANELEADEDTASYQWLDCDNGYSALSGDTAQTFSPLTNGNYAVELTNGPCQDTSGCHWVVASGVAEHAWKDALSFYPSPTRGKLTVELTGIEGPVVVTVRDMKGKRVRTERVEDPDRFQVSLGEEAGLYLIELRDRQGESKSFKVLKKE